MSHFIGHANLAFILTECYMHNLGVQKVNVNWMLVYTTVDVKMKPFLLFKVIIIYHKCLHEVCFPRSSNAWHERM